MLTHLDELVVNAEYVFRAPGFLHDLCQLSLGRLQVAQAGLQVGVFAGHILAIDGLVERQAAALSLDPRQGFIQSLGWYADGDRGARHFLAVGQETLVEVGRDDVTAHFLR